MSFWKEVGSLLAHNGQKRHGFEDGKNGVRRSGWRSGPLASGELKSSYDKAYEDGVRERMIKKGIRPTR